MKKALPFIIAGVLITALALLVVSHKNERNFDGRITLDTHDKIPYGTYVAYHLLQQQFLKATIETNRKSPADWVSLSYDTSGQVLLIVVPAFNPTETELDNLTAFAQKGNYVFISALQMNYSARKYFKVKQSSPFTEYGANDEFTTIKMKDSFAVKLDTATYKTPAAFAYPGISYDCEFTNFDSLYAYPLGFANNNKVNLLAINTDKGSIFLHSAPITFTNFFILYGNNHSYYEKLLSLVPANARKVVWDEYYIHRGYRNGSEGDDDSDGLLSVLFRYKPFVYAFWLAIVLLLLYLFTEIKRKQRLIPYYAKPTNDTLEFVTTIGKLYYEKGDHKNLAEKLTLFFLDYVRNKYKIATTEINTDFAHKLALKTNISQEEVVQITDALNEIRISQNISQQQLLHYHQLLENFYSKA